MYTGINCKMKLHFPEERMDKVNIAEKMSLFAEHWSPKVIGELNDSYIKAAKLKGEFLWHKHDAEDEMFLVVKGRLILKLRDRDIELNDGEFIIVPRGVEHMPVAEEEVEIILIEKKSTVNTGDVVSERTKETLEWI